MTHIHSNINLRANAVGSESATYRRRASVRFVPSLTGKQTYGSRHLSAGSNP